MDTQQETKKAENKKRLLYIGAAVVILVIYIASQSTPVPKVKAEKMVCWRCNKDLSNTNNYIDMYDGKYECTLCYDITQREIKDEMKTEGYNVK